VAAVLESRREVALAEMQLQALAAYGAAAPEPGGGGNMAPLPFAGRDLPDGEKLIHKMTNALLAESATFDRLAAAVLSTAAERG
jgi:hypothetical protein